MTRTIRKRNVPLPENEFLNKVRPHLEALLDAEKDASRLDIVPLPTAWYLNILMSFRDEFWRRFRDDFFEPALELAPNFGRPWSSQAFCFNLFYPYIRNSYDDLAMFQAMAGSTVGGILTAGFDRGCDSAQSARYDFAIEHQDGSCIFFVVRYAEERFSDGFMAAVDSLLQALHADPRHVIQFILPEANTALNADLDRILAGSCALRERGVDRIHIDRVLARVAQVHQAGGAETRYSDVIGVTHEDLMLDKYFPYMRDTAPNRARP